MGAPVQSMIRMPSTWFRFGSLITVTSISSSRIVCESRWAVWVVELVCIILCGIFFFKSTREVSAGTLRNRYQAGHIFESKGVKDNKIQICTANSQKLPNLKFRLHMLLITISIQMMFEIVYFCIFEYCVILESLKRIVLRKVEWVKLFL